MNSETGKWIMLSGVFLIVIGAIIYFFNDKVQWLGRLLGDVRIERANFRFYFPITATIILSLVLSLIIFLAKKFL